MIKKIFIFLLILLVIMSLIGIVLAAEYYEGIRITFYSDKIDKENCIEQLKSIDYKYSKGLNAIRVYDDVNPRAAGIYYCGSNVMVIDNKHCPKHTIIHELAHHKQCLMGEPLENMVNHKGNFCKYLKEIHDRSGYSINNYPYNYYC